MKIFSFVRKISFYIIKQNLAELRVLSKYVKLVILCLKELEEIEEIHLSMRTLNALILFLTQSGIANRVNMEILYKC